MPNKNQHSTQPRRQRRRGNKKVSSQVSPAVKAKAVQVGETVKQLENDIRFTDRRVNTSVANQLANQVKESIYEQTINASVISGAVIAYISYALQKGYMANATAENYPYYAFAYITQVLLNAVQNGTPLVDAAPYWLICLMQALSSKSVPFGNGQAAYRWKLDDPEYVPPSSVPLSVYPSSWWIWSPDPNATVDGFPVGDDTSQNPAYTTELGQQAWTSICEFMSSSSTLLGTKKENRMYPLSTKTPFIRDVSTYAVNVPQCGGGFNGTGAPFSTIQLEVPIIHPQFGVFNSQSILNPGVFRYPNYVTSSGGDVVFLGGLMSTLLTTKNYTMKRNPKFHFIDFNEFADVIAWWYTGCLQSLCNSPTFLTQYEGANSFNPVTYQCPLTFQEFLILIRNLLMGVFKDTQPSVQALHPHLLNSLSDQQFVPFSCGANSCFLSDAGGLQLPLPLIENLRATIFRYIYHQGTQEFPKDIEMWIPVVGAYANFTLDYSAYVVNVTFSNGETSAFNVFSAESNMVKRTLLKTSKGPSVKDEKVAEPLISIFDLSYFNGTKQVPVFANDPDRLATLQSLINGWFRTYLSTYSCSTGIFSADAGPSSLCTVNMTRYVYGFNSDSKAVVHDKHSRRANNDVMFVDTRLEGVKALGKIAADPYNQVGYATTSCTNTIMSAPYSGVLDVWILPIINAQDVQGSISYDTLFQRIQSALKEMYASIDSSGTTTITLATKHQIYAKKMYFSIMTPEDDWMIVIRALLTQGQGGILTSTIASMIPGTAGQICSAIAGLLPI